MAKTKPKSAAIVALISFVLATCLFGCSSGAPDTTALTKDASLKTDWGAIIQFKVGSDWEPSDYSSSSNSASYYNKNKENSLFIHIEDTSSTAYRYTPDSTYSDWQKSQEDYFSQSAQDIADLYNDPENPELYPDYTNFALNEIGSEDVDDVKYRLYKMSYTITMSDTWYNDAKEKNPGANKIRDVTSYYAIVKDGTHDLEICVNEENLLKDFLATLTVKW